MNIVQESVMYNNPNQPCCCEPLLAFGRFWALEIGFDIECWYVLWSIV